MRSRFIAGAAVVIAGTIGGCGASGFCSTHRCVGNLDHEHDSIVQCVDGTWSHSGGRQGACSGHRGERTSGGTDTSGLSGGNLSGGNFNGGNFSGGNFNGSLGNS